MAFGFSSKIGVKDNGVPASLTEMGVEPVVSTAIPFMWFAILSPLAFAIHSLMVCVIPSI